jgi:hypothetical protein
MVWRSFLMILNNEKLSWEWGSILHNLLREAETFTKTLRKSSTLFEDFIA